MNKLLQRLLSYNFNHRAVVLDCLLRLDAGMLEELMYFSGRERRPKGMVGRVPWFRMPPEMFFETAMTYERCDWLLKKWRNKLTGEDARAVWEEVIRRATSGDKRGFGPRGPMMPKMLKFLEQHMPKSAFLDGAMLKWRGDRLYRMLLARYRPTQGQIDKLVRDGWSLHDVMDACGGASKT